MKKQLLLLLLLFCAVCLNGFSLPVFYPAYGCETERVNEVDPIDLKGDLDKGPGFRSATDPIVAEKQGSSVFVYFQKNVGVLQVTVTGAQGQVFYTSANTATQTTLTISLAGLPAGEYVITFSNEKGMMTGNFSL